jgi:hypothetical protein
VREHDEYMLTIVLIVAATAAALGFFLWNLHYMLDYTCPRCRETSDEDEMILPVVPGWRWWCPGCNEIIQHRDIIPRESSDSDHVSDPEPPTF